MFSREKKMDEKEEKITEILCEKYNSYYRMAYSFVKNESDAEDIVQEGAYKAIKNSGSLKNVEYASTWLYRIMLNEIYRFTAERKKIISLDDTLMAGFESEDKYEDIDLKRALESMSTSDRVVIQLKYFEEFKLEEIAKVLDENVNTIKSRLYRSLKKLKIELQNGEIGDKEVKRNA